LSSKEHVKRQLDSPKEQLEYLGLCMGISMEFIDFPKVTGLFHVMLLFSHLLPNFDNFSLDDMAHRTLESKHLL